MIKQETARIRPMTEQEKAEFYTVPDGAIFHASMAEYFKACNELAERNAVFETGGHHPKFGSFWTHEKPNSKGE